MPCSFQGIISLTSYHSRGVDLDEDWSRFECIVRTFPENDGLSDQVREVGKELSELLPEVIVPDQQNVSGLIIVLVATDTVWLGGYLVSLCFHLSFCVFYCTYTTSVSTGL